MAEHTKLAEGTRRFSEAITAIEREAEVPRDAFNAVVFDFVASYCRHMEMEEEFFFLAAEICLTATDWLELGAETARYNPLSDVRERTRFKKMRSEIFDWARDGRG